MSPLQLVMHKALGGEYHLPDGSVFWMDRLAVDEIMRRLEKFEFRERAKPSDETAKATAP